MKSSKVDFSAQFGGQDAADVVLPHFKALKIACRDSFFESFPYRKMAYILRVDGEVTEFQLSGAGNIDIDSGGEYFSVDIGITRYDRTRLVDSICDAIAMGPELIRSSAVSADKIDFTSLESCLLRLISSYRDQAAHL
ncbi:MAG: hypothetical protein C0478_16550 [Planctomyces sp.]|jgi:hypothetical protein|nr:hypothetical protein [Planctomyces sp.]